MRRIATAVLFFVLATSVEAQKTKLGPMDIFNLEYATSPEISPDGQWVVYVRQYFDVMTDRRYSNLWIARSDGSDHRPLTAGKYTEGEPVWSPDGKRLAYISTREGSPQIYVRWMDNGQTSPITKVQEPHPPGEVQARFDAANRSATDLATGANVAYGVAGVAAATAIVLFFIEK